MKKKTRNSTNTSTHNWYGIIVVVVFVVKPTLPYSLSLIKSVLFLFPFDCFTCLVWIAQHSAVNTLALTLTQPHRHWNVFRIQCFIYIFRSRFVLCVFALFLTIIRIHRHRWNSSYTVQLYAATTITTTTTARAQFLLYHRSGHNAFVSFKLIVSWLRTASRMFVSQRKIKKCVFLFCVWITWNLIELFANAHWLKVKIFITKREEKGKTKLLSFIVFILFNYLQQTNKTKKNTYTKKNQARSKTKATETDTLSWMLKRKE